MPVVSALRVSLYEGMLFRGWTFSSRDGCELKATMVAEESATAVSAIATCVENLTNTVIDECVHSDRTLKGSLKTAITSTDIGLCWNACALSPDCT